jgi:hypothetical protein
MVYRADGIRMSRAVVRTRESPPDIGDGKLPEHAPALGFAGALGGIRTPNLLIRRAAPAMCGAANIVPDLALRLGKPCPLMTNFASCLAPLRTPLRT